MRLSPAFEDGPALLEAASAQGLEGVVAKRADAPYRPGRRTPEWQKLKLRQEDDFPIVGFTRGTGRRAKLGALVLGRREADGLHWAGNVGSGIGDGDVESLLAVLRPLSRPTSPLVATPRMPRVRAADVTWVEPTLAAEVTFAERTREGRLRAPVFLGIRDDVPVERPPIAEEIRKGRRTLRLSNLDKPFWPDEGITKGELLAYYRDVSKALVPHLRKRPFTMKRYPDGWQGKSFFQKQAPSHIPDWIETAAFPASTREGEKKVIDYALVDDELALLWMVNMGCIDMHTWASRADRPERPDWVMFDLDPSEGATFEEVVRSRCSCGRRSTCSGSSRCRRRAGRAGSTSSSRSRVVTGSTRCASSPASSPARSPARTLVSSRPNGRRPSAVASSSMRTRTARGRPPRPSTRCARERERPSRRRSAGTRLGPGLDIHSFTMDVVLDRVRREGDLFARVLEGGQSLGAALRAVR